MRGAERPHLGRRLRLLVLGAAAWTLFAMYPNPAVLARNLARYRRLPLDSDIERRMHWDLPHDPDAIEFFVDSLLIPSPDWPTYRVPWYVPTALEAARSVRGDCETKAILLASLLEGKRIPYELRASLAHIWVDYAGRAGRPGESRDLAYLQGRPGRFRFHWPERVSWRDLFRAQSDQLWGAMPLARKSIWLFGLAWVALAALLLGGPTPRGELVSQWRVPVRSYLARAGGLGLVALAAIIVAPALRPDGSPARWTPADLYEVVSLSLLAGAFLTWLGVVRPRRAVSFERAEGEPRLHISSSCGLWQRAIILDAPDVGHLELVASPGGLRPWAILAALPRGERVALLRYRREVAARAALRRLGRELNRPVVVRADGREYWTAADEIGSSLRETTASRPEQGVPEQPNGCYLVTAESSGQWSLGYPPREAGAGRLLLAVAAIPAAMALIAIGFLVFFPRSALVWVVSIAATVLVGMTVYAAMALRAEVLAWLAGAHVEVGKGELSYHGSEGRVESLPLEDVESVEIGRKGETPTVAVVAPERVLHIELHCPVKHLEWARGVIEHAIAHAPP